MTLAGPSGFEPESQPSEGWALSRWTMDRLKLGWPEEIESSWTVPQTAAYPLGHGHTWCQRRHNSATASLTNMVEEEGIEPSSAGCWPAVLPLDDSPTLKFGARGDNRNPDLRFTRAALFRLSYSGIEPNLNRHGADAENRTLLVGLAVRCPANRRHPRKLWSGRR